ncbi:hypothetical protein JNW91_00595 [Micromonospora sp. STR1_7]|uniref:Uncharacterized protein n=1 Tax=Micromonospora parastrephiae TaxID=2806101 RepID=A0ABS1XML4_9ACTN|nr:hypothetical protein [Micromonospora parastrephiae]MBM0230500.1 hypothetical protein [Micromonospora parastrephiae]
MTSIERVRILHGHTSPDTAYQVDDYPYSYTLRCTIRYWIETATKGAKKGEQRFMSQTTNPKRPGEPWNKPKGDTYNLMQVMYLDGNEHVQTWGVSAYGISPEGDAVFRLKGLYDQLTDAQRAAYDQLIAIAKRYPDSWQSWENKVTAVAEYLRAGGGEPEPVNGVWISPDGERHHLGSERDTAACLAIARQRLSS